MADVIPFDSKSKPGSYDKEGIKLLRDPEFVPRRSQVTWLGECSLPDSALWELTRLLEKYPELWAVQILDKHGSEMTLFTDQLPTGYGAGFEKSKRRVLRLVDGAAEPPEPESPAD
jgi:hypothetical protein